MRWPHITLGPCIPPLITALDGTQGVDGGDHGQAKQQHQLRHDESSQLRTVPATDCPSNAMVGQIWTQNQIGSTKHATAAVGQQLEISDSKYSDNQE